VAEVISINGKLQLAEEKKADLIRRRKILAVQKAFQCTHCAAKCLKCGTQIGVGSVSKDKAPEYRVPYNFCESCSQEYLSYIDRLKGRGDSDCYWHNDAWLDLWKKFIDYQAAIDRYLKSKEFIQLLYEIKQIRSDK